MWCLGGSLVGGMMREPALRRIVGAQHFRQASECCFSRGALALAVEVLNKNPPHVIFRFALDCEAIVALGPRGDEVTGASDPQRWPAPAKKAHHPQERGERGLGADYVIAIPTLGVEQT